jgi:two-component system sensor histidine kinase/response regulator
MMERLFVTGLPADPLFWARHDPLLVVLSVLIAVFASIMAMHMVALVKNAPDGWMRRVSQGTGCLALGGGVWAMHFVGMLAYDLCATGAFDAAITAWSMVPGVVASAAAMAVLHRQRPRPIHLVAGGALVGAGIGAMHYIGMSAAEIFPSLRYDLWSFLASIALAMVLSVMALWVRFGLHTSRTGGRWQITVASGVAMGLAISAMHYMGMLAIRTVGELPPVSAEAPIFPTGLALGIAAVTLAFSLLVIAANAALRYRQSLAQSRASEAQLAAVIGNVEDAIVLVNGEGDILSFNAAAERILGWSAHEAVGRNLQMVMAAPDAAPLRELLFAFLRSDQPRYAQSGEEVHVQNRHGAEVPVRLSAGRIDVTGQRLCVVLMADLTARRAIERSLRYSEEQLRLLIGNIPGVTFRCAFDENLSMHFITESVEQLTGWSAQAFLDGQVHFASLIHPEDRDRVWSVVQEAILERRAYRLEYRITHRSGEVRWVSEGGRGFIDGPGNVLSIDGVILDNTPFKARDAEFEGTVNAIGRRYAVVDFDLQGRVLDVNQNFCELTGFTRDQLIGGSHAMFCDPQWVGSPSYRTFWAQLVAGDVITGDFQRFGRDGNEVWAQVSYNPIFDANGRPFKIMVLASDLKPRRAMEMALRAAKEQAEQAAAARSTFLANMSHEIRTPMNAILGFTGALLDSPLNADQRRQLGIAHQASQSLLRLLNDILDSAKLEKGGVKLEIRDFEPRDVIGQVLESIGPAAERKGLRVEVAVDASVPAYLKGDSFRVQQVLVNLVDNAIKFTARGHVALRAAYAQGQLTVDVQDTGIGIDASQLQKIFDPFAQADASTTRQFGGTGLGTSISRQLAELMGGVLQAHSTLGEGSTFTLRVPLPPGQPVDDNAGSIALQLPPLRILAADDVAHNLELLQIMFAPGGHDITLVQDGLEALETFSKSRFDVVLMDLQMRALDGLEATRRIRALEASRQQVRTPIIALSASVLERHRREARDAGMDGFASKPLDRPKLMAEVARVVGLAPGAHNVPRPIGGASSLEGDRPASPLHGGSAPQGLPIDWNAGVQLWQSLAALQRAIAQYLQTHAQSPQRLQALAQTQAWAEVAELAHRMRGAAANLALAPLFHLLGRLEHAASAGEGATVASALIDLPFALDAVAQSLASAGHGRAENPQAQSGTPGAGQPSASTALTPAQRSELQQDMEALERALAHSELHESALAGIQQRLPAGPLAPLNEAIGHFDLPEAMRQLKILQAQWCPPSTETLP